MGMSIYYSAHHPGELSEAEQARIRRVIHRLAGPQVGFEVFDVLTGVGDAVAEEDDPTNPGQESIVIGMRGTGNE
jgi:hypothetical protein